MNNIYSIKRLMAQMHLDFNRAIKTKNKHMAINILTKSEDMCSKLDDSDPLSLSLKGKFLKFCKYLKATLNNW